MGARVWIRALVCGSGRSCGVGRPMITRPRGPPSQTWERRRRERSGHVIITRLTGSLHGPLPRPRGDTLAPHPRCHRRPAVPVSPRGRGSPQTALAVGPARTQPRSDAPRGLTRAAAVRTQGVHRPAAQCRPAARHPDRHGRLTLHTPGVALRAALLAPHAEAATGMPASSAWTAARSRLRRGSSTPAPRPGSRRGPCRPGPPR